MLPTLATFHIRRGRWRPLLPRGDDSVDPVTAPRMSKRGCPANQKASLEQILFDQVHNAIGLLSPLHSARCQQAQRHGDLKFALGSVA